MAVITNPEWLRKPNGDDYVSYYPQRAMDLGKPGSATIKCSVRANGTLENCVVTSEDPPGFDFGAATLRISKLWKMKPKTADGQAVEGAEVTIPLRWQLAG